MNKLRHSTRVFSALGKYWADFGRPATAVYLDPVFASALLDDINQDRVSMNAEPITSLPIKMADTYLLVDHEATDMAIRPIGSHDAYGANGRRWEIWVKFDDRPAALALATDDNKHAVREKTRLLENRAIRTLFVWDTVRQSGFGTTPGLARAQAARRPN